MAGIFDAFTGNAQSAAQQNARSFLDDIRFETGQELGQGLGQGLGYLQGSLNPQLQSLQNAFNTANQQYGTYANAGVGAVNTGANQAAQSVYSMLNPAVGALNPAVTQYGDERARAAAMSNSALGLTDPSVARNAFRTSPAYQFMLDEGLNSIARNANAAGMVASGNQMRESQKYGSGLADKEWDDWLNRLMGREQLYAPLQLQGGAKLADTYSAAGRTLADLQSQAGRSTGNIYAQQARDLATIANQFGGAQAGIFGQNAQAQADFLRQLLGLKTQANVGLAGGEAQTFIGQGDAAAQASKNIFDALLGAAKLAAGSGGLGSLFGGGSTGGTINITGANDVTNVA